MRVIACCQPTVLSGRYQRGIGWFSGLLVLSLLVVLLKVGLAVLPAYSEYASVRGVIKAALNEPVGYEVTPYELRERIAKRFAVNRVATITADDLVIRQDENGMQVAFDYDVVAPLFYNVSVQLHFADRLSGKR